MYLLVLSSDGLNGWNWARLKLGSHNRIGSPTLELGPRSPAFLGAVAGDWIWIGSKLLGFEGSHGMPAVS